MPYPDRLEVRFALPVRAFVKEHNARFSSKVKRGEKWVRVQPCDENDLEACQKDTRFIKFFRVGSEVHVKDVLGNFVDAHCGGDQVLIEVDEFLSSWIRIVASDEWRPHPGYRPDW